MFDYFTSELGTNRCDLAGCLNFLDKEVWHYHGTKTIDDLPKEAFPFMVAQGGRFYHILSRTEKAVKVLADCDKNFFYVPKSRLFSNGKINISYFYQKACIERDKWANRQRGLS